MQTVYVVEVFNREDGVYVFERYEDAQDFADLVVEQGDEFSCALTSQVLISAEFAPKVMEDERES